MWGRREKEASEMINIYLFWASRKIKLPLTEKRKGCRVNQVFEGGWDAKF